MYLYNYLLIYFITIYLQQKTTLKGREIHKKAQVLFEKWKSENDDKRLSTIVYFYLH